jgi:hypothetical protein
MAKLRHETGLLKLGDRPKDLTHHFGGRRRVGEAGGGIDRNKLDPTSLQQPMAGQAGRPNRGQSGSHSRSKSRQRCEPRSTPAWPRSLAGYLQGRSRLPPRRRSSPPRHIALWRILRRRLPGALAVLVGSHVCGAACPIISHRDCILASHFALPPGLWLSVPLVDMPTGSGTLWSPIHSPSRVDAHRI